MEFTIWCPTDGTVGVDLDDIDSIIVRGGSDVEVVFNCPVCGRVIKLEAQVPHAFMASLEEGWVRIDGDDRLIALRREDGASGSDDENADSRSDDRIESYCEYFRRELADADTVDQVLSEIDAHEVW